jgi:hypothetical protein
MELRDVLSRLEQYAKDTLGASNELRGEVLRSIINDFRETLAGLESDSAHETHY